MLVDVRGRAAIDRVTVDRTGSSVVPPCAHLGHGSGLGRRGEGRGGEGRGGEERGGVGEGRGGEERGRGGESHVSMFGSLHMYVV